MSNIIVGRPENGEYADYAAGYVERVETDDIIGFLEKQLASCVADLKGIPKEKHDFRYQEGKWSVQEVAGHIVDTERVMSFRAFAFGRGDEQEYPGMDENSYAANSNYDVQNFDDIVDQFSLVRRANLHLIKGFSGDVWRRRGVASGSEVSVRALAYIMGGHVEHHLEVLKDRYLNT